MKKTIIWGIIASAILLSGTVVMANTTETGDIVQEQEIEYNQIIFQDDVITYNTKIPESLYSYETTKFGLPETLDQPIKVVTNSEGIIRALYVLSDKIETHDGIRVGMSANSVTETYPDTVLMGRMLSVYFDEDGNTVKLEDLIKGQGR